MSAELDHKTRLAMARAADKEREKEGKLDEIKRKYHDAKKIGKEAKTLVKSVTPWGFFSLLSHFSLFSDWPYGLAFVVSLFKDMLDIIGIGSLPAIGTIVTLCASIFIGFMMTLANAMEKDRTTFQKTLIRYLILIFGTLVEMLFFGINFAPGQTAMIIIIYCFVLAARKNAADTKKRSGEASEQYA